MAYIKKLRLYCAYHPVCQEQATVQVYNHRNTLLGQYCRQHGEERQKLEVDKAKGDV